MRTANAKLRNATQRGRLAVRAAPYFNTIAPKRLLGYVKAGGTIAAGRWIVQVETGRNKDTGQPERRRQVLGVADDLAPANGTDVLSYDQALARAINWTPPSGPSGGRAFTVRDAVEQHRNFNGNNGNKTKRNKARAYASLRYHVLCEHPDGSPRDGAKGLGDIAVNALTTERLTAWRDALIDPTRKGSKANAQRIWTNLHSALEQAYRKESNGITSPKAWHKVACLSQEGSRRDVHFTNEEALAIIAQARSLDAPVGDYFDALFSTGTRPGGELFALRVRDFNPTLSQLTIQGRDEDTTSKTGERTISLDDAAVALFTRLVAGRPSTAPLFSPDGVNPWDMDSHQKRIKAVLLASGAPADAVPYSFRHTFISRRLEAGMPTPMVAKHCGTSVWMIERNYAKFVPSETLRWLRATAPSARRSVQLVKAGEQQPALREAA